MLDPAIHHGNVRTRSAAARLAISLDDAAAVDESRRHSAMTSLYRALLLSLPEQDQQWVLDVVARHREAERQAEERGDPLPGPAW